MLFLLSPAKAHDYDSANGDVPHTQPLFVKQSALVFNGDVYGGLDAKITPIH